MEALRQRGEISTIAVRETSEMERAFPPPSGAQENGHDPKATLRTALRRFFHGLRKTPLHPQWIVTRREEKHLQEIAGFLRGRVLDVGSGDRRLENYLPPQIRYIAVDYPPSGRRYRSLPHIWGDAMRLPFCSGMMDSLVLLEVLEHLPDARAAISEAARVLKSGGLVVATLPFLYPIHDAPFDFGRITQYLIERLAADAGLEIRRLAERGTAMETAALLASLALTQSAIEALQRKHPLALVLAPALFLVPILNMLGYGLSRLLPIHDFMPLGYLAVLEKR
jgi:SAM-dependent methyltransferase